MALQIRRGLSTEMTASVTPLDGEIIYNTDTGKLFVGNGSLTANLLPPVNADPNLSQVGGISSVNQSNNQTFFYNFNTGNYENSQINFQKLMILAIRRQIMAM